MITGSQRITAERANQLQQGYSIEKDRKHQDGEMVGIAMHLARREKDYVETSVPVWASKLIDGLREKHRCDRIQLLAIAGAFIAAEIDRLQRSER